MRTQERPVFLSSKINTEKLSLKVHRAIMDELEKNGGFYNKLPSEAELADMFGVSRSVLRDVLANLESQGYVSRKRGIGTIVNNHIVSMKERIDIDHEVPELLESIGYDYDIRNIEVTLLKANEAIKNKLFLSHNDECYSIQKCYYVDNVCAAITIDIFPKNIIKVPFNEENITGSIYDFFEEKCQVEVETNVTNISGILSESIPNFPKAKKMEQQIYVEVNEVGYSTSQQPVLWSRQYFHNDYFHLSLLRRKQVMY